MAACPDVLEGGGYQGIFWCRWRGTERRGWRHDARLADGEGQYTERVQGKEQRVVVRLGIDTRKQAVKRSFDGAEVSGLQDGPAWADQLLVEQQVGELAVEL